MKMVDTGLVSGWDDPRLLTLAGLRRRGYTPTAINNFCERIGIARSSNTVCLNKNTLEACAREELDRDAKR
jgi:glutaminyl-tRNA synthetase